MSAEIDLDHLRGWIGAEETMDDDLTAAVVGRFCATLAPAGALPDHGEATPRLIHFCLCQPAAPMAGLGTDGHPKRGGFLPPVPLPRRMWAGSEITFYGDLHVGDRVHKRSKIDDVEVKRGASGLLCFVTIDHTISVDHALRLQERQTIVYRPAHASGAPIGRAAAPMAAVTIPVEPSPALLFRYSAMTFNGHRIHYDRPYAVDVEGYAGLVIHGPLQATMLLQLAAQIEGRPPDNFAFRAQSVLDGGEIFNLNAGLPTDGTLPLWTSTAEGGLAMRAQARWR